MSRIPAAASLPPHYPTRWHTPSTLVSRGAHVSIPFLDKPNKKPVQQVRKVKPEGRVISRNHAVDAPFRYFFGKMQCICGSGSDCHRHSRASRSRRLRNVNFSERKHTIFKRGKDWLPSSSELWCLLLGSQQLRLARARRCEGLGRAQRSKRRHPVHCR